MKSFRIVITAIIACAFLLSTHAYAAKSAEEKLARKSGCFKCHAKKKEKKGPSYQEIANKYRGDAEAEAKLFEHATTNPKVEVEGKEQEHKTLKTEDPAKIKAVIKWVLAQ